MTNLSRSETVMYVNQKFSDKYGQNSIQGKVLWNQGT